MQNLERQLNKETRHEKDSNSDLRVIKVQFEPFIHSKLLEPFNYNSYDLETRRDFKEYTQMEAQTFKETIIQHMNFIEKCIVERANHEQVLQKRLNERKLQIQGCTFQEVKALDAILEDNAKKRWMVSLRQLHLHLKRLSQNDLQGSRTESGFKHAFVKIFGQDLETFTGTMFFNVEQLEKQLDKEDFQELGSMAAFNAILEFRDTLIQYLESVKKSIDERAQHKKEYDSWVNERQMQIIEEKVDTSKALDASLVDKESSGTESKKQDTCSRSGNNAHADDADIRPIYDEEPMTVSQFLKEKSNEAKVKHDIDVLETINIALEHKVAKLLKENETLKKHYKELFDSIKITRAKTIEYTTSLIASNDNFKAQLQEKGFAIAALKNELRKLKGNSVNTKFVKQSVLGKPMLQSHRNQSVIRQPTAFKSERPRISEPRSQSTANGSKPKPRSNTQTSRNWPASNSSFATTKTIPIAENSRNSRNFSDTKHFVCSTCQKCVFNANHDSYVTKFLKEVNSRAKVPSNKIMNRSKPVEQISVPNKQERQISTGHRFSIKKTSAVQKKTMSPRSCLSWKPTGRIFKTDCLRWVPTGKIFASSTTKVDIKPLNGSNADITNQYECKQTLDVSAGTLNLSACTSFNLKKEGLRVWLLKR
uniref:Integrase, catalytic region, zinc finger, CCHC-type, peptidase aspartic, catalytic n=1 Tax=Tanacetum cinerariifolium TaxID=118510 RepID=A0A6L2JP40_TANCI|nr:hypothetical protein [Tanacetum cinerariifolium]